MRPTVRPLASALALLAASLFAAGQAQAQAQFKGEATPSCKQPAPSNQAAEKEYRTEASRHLYGCYPTRVFRGKLPPLLYGVMMVETELDAKGNVVDVNVIRKPAADEVAPFVVAMIKKASPYPAPVKLAASGNVKFMETYFVDKSGLFQTYSLTEGQRSK